VGDVPEKLLRIFGRGMLYYIKSRMRSKLYVWFVGKMDVGMNVLALVFDLRFVEVLWSFIVLHTILRGW